MLMSRASNPSATPPDQTGSRPVVAHGAHKLHLQTPPHELMRRLCCRHNCRHNLWGQDGNETGGKEGNNPETNPVASCRARHKGALGKGGWGCTKQT